MRYNPWHGCHKISAGCLHCYVYRIDARYERNASKVVKTKEFDLPLRKHRDGSYVVPGGETLYTCFSSDFFIEEADSWRPEVWAMMKARSDVFFFLTTKRIARFLACKPQDWGEGYPNVTIACTVENQEQADIRLPIYETLPIRHKMILCEPLLGQIDLKPWLTPKVELVLAGGESGPDARVCDYAWVKDLRDQAVQAGVPFHFKQTGANFRKDAKTYHIARPLQASQAAKAGIDFNPK